LRISVFLILPWISVLLLSACGVQASPTPLPTSTDKPAPTSTVKPAPTKRITVGIDIELDLPPGDPERGEAHARAKSCIHCHVDAIATRFESGNDVPEIMARGDIRITDPDYRGSATTGEEYIIESILIPDIYIVPGTPAGAAMPTNYDELLTKQDLADPLAWLSTFE
jgi:hypothetical protein